MAPSGKSRTNLAKFIKQYFEKQSNVLVTCKVCNQDVRTSGNTTNMNSHFRRKHPNLMQDISAYKDVNCLPLTYPVSDNSLKGLTTIKALETVKSKLEKPETSGKQKNSFIRNLKKCFEKKSEVLSICQLCSKEVKTCGNTSNMRAHFQRKHKELYQHIISSEVELIIHTSGTVEAYPSPSTALVPIAQYSAEVENPCYEGTAMVQSNSTSLYDNGGSKHADITSAIVLMLCKDLLHLRTVEEPGFRHLMKTLVPHYEVPNCKAMEEVLENLYHSKNEMLKNKIHFLGFLSLSVEIWGVENNFLCLTVHFLEMDYCSSMSLGCFELGEQLNTETLALVLKDALEDWGIQISQIVAIVINYSCLALREAVFHLLGEDRIVPCFAEALKSIPVEATANTSELPQLLYKVKLLSTYFINNPNAMDALIKAQGESILRPKAATNEFWNSTFYMIDIFINIYDHIVAVANEDTPEIPSSIEMDALKEILLILKPIEKVTFEVSSEKYLTMSKAIPLAKCLKKAVQNVKPSTSLAMELKENVLGKIDEQFGQLERILPIASSTLLDPRFKRIHFEDDSCCATTIASIEEELKQITSPDSKGDSNSTQSTGSDDNDDIWSYHSAIVGIHSMPNNNACLNELDQYITATPSPRQMNPLFFWSDKKQVYLFPTLKEVAKKYLCIPATSLPSEYLFTKEGQCFMEKRNLLGAKGSKLLALRSFLD